MHIDRIQLFHLALPFQQPQRIADRQVEALETVLVRIHSGGVSGWGEAAPGNAPRMSGEWAAGGFAVLRDWLAPALTGRTIDTADDLNRGLDAFRGNQFAKGALDAAWWDLQARLEGRPLHEMLAGRRTAIEVGPTFDRMESVEEFLSLIGQAFDAGFARVKLKFRPGWDVEMLRVVRQEFPAQTIHIDVEGRLGVEHMEMLCRLDDFMLAMIEQPLPADDFVGSAMVQETIRTPICLDEGIVSLIQAEIALDLNSGKYVSLKPGRVGGLTSAAAIHDACRASSVPCWVGAVPQSAIGARCHLALAAKENCTYPADFFPSDQVLAQDLADPLPPARDADGVMRIPLWSQPGIGVEPDEVVLEKYCIGRTTLG